MDYSYYPGTHPQQFSMYGLPTPDRHESEAFPSLNNYSHDYNAFNSSFRIDPTAFVPPHSPPESFSKHSVSSNELPNNPTNSSSVDGGDDQFADLNPARSSSEEKEGLTPAQSRRKAQNRAAQRAFRERKERHVRELEEKVNSLEQSSSTLAADNERLKRELARFATENEILRATSSSNPGGQPSEPVPTTTGPMEYSPTDFYSNLVPGGKPNPRHRITVCEITGERLLDAGATWHLIQEHELFKKGLVDIGDVCERLKGMAQCDGQGPAFKEGQIRKAIEESVAGGSDELI